MTDDIEFSNDYRSILLTVDADLRGYDVIGVEWGSGLTPTKG